MRNDATSTQLRDERAAFTPHDSDAALGDAVLAGLSLPVWVLDVSAFTAHSASGAIDDDEGTYARFLDEVSIVATNVAAIEFHKAASATDLMSARERIFSPLAVREIVAAAGAAAAGRHREIDIELGTVDGTPQRVRARLDFIATGAGGTCCALTILPVRPQASLLRAVPDIVFELDAAGIYVDFSGPEDALLLPSAFIGKSITETMPPDVAHRTLAALTRLHQRGGSERFEYALSMSDGLHWYEANMSALPSGGAATYVRDVTELKSAEWRRQESEERCRALGADLRARTLDLERAHHELDEVRRSSDQDQAAAGSLTTE